MKTINYKFKKLKLSRKNKNHPQTNYKQMALKKKSNKEKTSKTIREEKMLFCTQAQR